MLNFQKNKYPAPYYLWPGRNSKVNRKVRCKPWYGVSDKVIADATTYTYNAIYAMMQKALEVPKASRS